MNNPDKPAWLVPISRVVNHAVQPGTIYVNAGSQAKALEIARSHIQEDGENAPGVEWEPVSEIQDADWPVIDDDLRNVLPVDDTQPPPLRSRFPEKEPGIEITVSENAVCALVEALEAILAEFTPTDEREEKHKEGLAEWVNALFFANRIVLGPGKPEPDASAAEPIAAEAGQ